MVYLATTALAGSGLAVVTATGLATELGRIGQLVALAGTPGDPARAPGRGARPPPDRGSRSRCARGRARGHPPRAADRADARDGHQPRGGRDPRGAAGRHDGGARRRPLAPRPARRPRPPAARRGDARLHDGDLLGQDRNDDREPHDGDAARGSTGASWTLDGGSRGESRPLADPHVALLLTAAAVVNDATAVAAPDGLHLTGDPTETALLVAAAQGRTRSGRLARAWPRRREIPFDPARRMMATFNDAPGGRPRRLRQGRPERRARPLAPAPDGRRRRRPRRRGPSRPSSRPTARSPARGCGCSRVAWRAIDSIDGRRPSTS